MNSLGRAVLVFAMMLFIPGACFAQDKTADQILAEAKAIYSQQGAKTALPEYEKALAAYKASQNKLGEAITIGLIGNCYKRLGDYPKAIEMLNNALAMKRELHDHLEEGKTLSNLGLVYWELSEYPKAIQSYNESIAIARELANVQLEASALNNLSLVYDEQGEYQRSLEQYQKALELHRSIKYEPGESDTLGNIGGVYLSLGRFSEAESYYRQALEISRRLEAKPSETQDLGNIAICQLGQGRIRDSIPTFDQALAIAGAAGMYKEEADWYRGRASALLQTGQFDLAMKDFERSEQSYARAGLKREEAEVLTDSAMAFWALGDKLSAQQKITKAISISKEIGYSRGIVLNQLALAEVLMRSGNLQQSRKMANTALAGAKRLNQADAEVQSLLLSARISSELHLQTAAETATEEARQKAHEGGLRLLEANSLEFSGELRLKQHQPEQALGKLDDAVAIAADAGDVDMLWRAQYHRGRALEMLHNNDEAVSAYRAAINTIEDVRSLIAERRFRTGYFQDKQRVYVALISLLLRIGKTGDAFESSERLREFSYLQLQEDVPDSTSSKITESKARIRRLQQMLDREENKPGNEQRSAAKKIYSEELIAAQRELESLLDKGGDNPSPQVAGKVTPSLIQAALPQHTALLEYVVEEHHLAIFVLTRSNLQAVVKPVSERDLSAKVDLFRDLVSDGKSDLWRKPAASLRLLLISPIERQGLLDGVTSLLIVGHGVLNNLPYAALPSGSSDRYTFLAEQYEIAELPDAHWLLKTSRIGKPDTSQVLAMAPGNSNLKYSIPEAVEIARLFAPDSLALTGSRATETAFKANAGRYGIIHLATHGFFNPVNPLFSGLELEADSTNDGRLEVHEIMALHLHARLVTLSACDTALGGGDFSDIPAGDEFVGLSRAFLEAGSDAVLASLWKVDDRSTTLMMGLLYRSMKGRSGPKALAVAQRSMIADPQYRHPFYWAPFVFVGGDFSNNRILAEKQ